MAAIYLRHPVHGEKVACSDVEAEYDRGNGWVDFDPTTPQVEGGGKEAPEVPAEHPLDAYYKAQEDALTPEVPVTQPVVPVTPTPEVPSFLAPVTEVVSDLPADFPGRESLIAGGLPMWGDLIDKTAEELIALKGIGPATAALILKAMDS
jgi:hypothetical protein